MKNYILKLADDALIMGQRLSEWCGKGPYLEEDIAIINIALDLMGQANNWYSLATKFWANGRTVDDFAMLRMEKDYLNAQLVELPNGDYARTILKVYFLAVYHNILYRHLSESADEDVKAVAVKSLKEVRYHYTHADTWMGIFANSTAEARMRLEQALQDLWEYTGGLFDVTPDEDVAVGAGVIPASAQMHQEFLAKVKEDFNRYQLEIPVDSWMQKGSRQGIHTEWFGYILCELQYMQRAYPNCAW